MGAERTDQLKWREVPEGIGEGTEMGHFGLPWRI